MSRSAERARATVTAAPTADTLRAALAGLDLEVCADAAARTGRAIAGHTPALVVAPADRAALAAAVAALAARGAALVPLGLGAHRALGHRPVRYDVALSTARLARLVDYTPADMTVVVESGMPLAALVARLAAEGQWLPVDPPLADATTIGGLVAADLAGPLRASQGRIRDYVIGIGVVLADGRPARAGGRVVKNVAGYDLMKLFTGSLGTLGVIVELALKVRPRPAAMRCIALAFRDVAAALVAATPAAAGMLAATLVVESGDAGGDDARRAEAGGPPPVDADPRRPLLLMLAGGEEEDVAVARARVGALAAAHGAAVALDVDGADAAAHPALAAARDHLRSAAGNLAARLATVPAAGPALLAALLRTLGPAPARCQLDPRTGLVALTMQASDPAAAIVALRRVAAEERAHLVLERWPDALADTVEVWSPLPPALPLMRRMKAALDPAGTLAPGRHVGRL